MLMQGPCRMKRKQAEVTQREEVRWSRMLELTKAMQSGRVKVADFMVTLTIHNLSIHQLH